MEAEAGAVRADPLRIRSGMARGFSESSDIGVSNFNPARLEALIATARHAPEVDQVALAWAVHRGAVATPKSVHSVRQKANLAAAKIELSEKEIHEIDALNRDYSHFVGEVWTENGSPYRRKWLS